MRLKVNGSEKVLYDEEVYGFKVRAMDGELVCLNGHMDYLSLLQKGELVVLSELLSPLKTVPLAQDFILMIEKNTATLFS
ncbi:MAG: hypothetical protein AABZ14_05135 [Candidatus Margulisiibacteriota bacterium]